MAAPRATTPAPTSSHRTAGVLGAVAGLAAAGIGVGLAVHRAATRRVSAEHLDPQQPGSAENPLGRAARRADRSTSVDTDDGVSLAVEEVGPLDAPLTVVFVHGYALSMASWTFQRRALGAELATVNGSLPRARLVFYDQRGHGASGRGASAHSTMAQLGADLAAVLAARAPRGPVVLVGHSMGGMTIMALAALHPELFGSRVVGAALISTSSGNLAQLSFGLPEFLTRARAAVIPAAAWTARRSPMLAERARRAVASVVSSATWALSFGSGEVDPGLGRYVDAMIASTPLDVIAEFYPAIAGLDQTGSLAPLRAVPTLVLTGEGDRLIPPEHSENLVELLGGAAAERVEEVVVTGAGHLVLLEQHEQVSAALSGLIRRVSAARGGGDSSA